MCSLTRYSQQLQQVGVTLLLTFQMLTLPKLKVGRGAAPGGLRVGLKLRLLPGLQPQEDCASHPERAVHSASDTRLCKTAAGQGGRVAQDRVKGRRWGEGSIENLHSPSKSRALAKASPATNARPGQRAPRERTAGDRTPLPTSSEAAANVPKGRCGQLAVEAQERGRDLCIFLSSTPSSSWAEAAGLGQNDGGL